jgi:hypothetical protein
MTTPEKKHGPESKPQQAGSDASCQPPRLTPTVNPSSEQQTDQADSRSPDGDGTEKQIGSSSDHRRTLAEGMKPWKPGQSGNPSGRPKKIRHIPDILARITNERLPPKIRAQMAQLYPDLSNRPTFLEAILRVVVQKALKGESWAVEFVAERTEGKVVTPIDLSTGQQMKIVEEIVDVGD